MIEKEIFKNMREAGIPAIYSTEHSTLRKAKDKIGERLLVDVLDSELELHRLLTFKFWNLHHRKSHRVREVFYLLARALCLEEKDVFVACPLILGAALLTDKINQDDEDFQYLDRALGCDVLFLQDFYDCTYDPTYRHPGMHQIMKLIRYRIERGQNVITYSTSPIKDCKAWPETFRAYLQEKAYEVVGVGNE